MDPNDKALTSFTMLGHAMFHTYELVIPLFVVIWLDTFAVSPAYLGVVVGVSYALTGIGALPSGILSDTYSSKRLILACMVGMGAGFVIVSLAPSISILTIGLLLWGAAASIYHPAGLALISRGAKERGTAFAFHGAAGNVGVATGPLLATILLAFFEWRIVAGILVIPVVIAILAGIRLEFDERAAVDGQDRTVADGGGEIRTFGDFIRNTKLLFTGAFLIAFAISIFYGMYYRGAFTFLPDILADLPLFEPAEVFGRTIEPSQYVFSGLLILGGAGQFVGGKLVDRVQAEYVLIGNFVALTAVALLFMPAANAGLVPLLVVAGLLGFLVFMEAPVNQEVISKYAPTDVRGLSFGYVYVAVLGIGAIGATIAGIILTRSTPMMLFVVVAGFAVVAIILGVYLTRQ